MTAPLVAPKPADKPGSVVGGHLSGTAVTRRLKRPTRGSDGTGRPVPAEAGSPLLGLAPGGGCLAARVATSAGGLLHHLFTLTRLADQPGGLLFCGPFPPGVPAWVLPSTVPCGARTFLTPRTGRDRLAGLGANSMITYYQWLSRGQERCISLLTPATRSRGC